VTAAQVLRLAGWGAKAAREATEALLQCLPRLHQRDVGESWEEWVDSMPSASQVKHVHGNLAASY
jgi:hypothetical protein